MLGLDMFGFGHAGSLEVSNIFWWWLSHVWTGLHVSIRDFTSGAWSACHDSTLEVFGHLQENDVADVIAYNATMTACGNAHQWTQVTSFDGNAGNAFLLTVWFIFWPFDSSHVVCANWPYSCLLLVSTTQVGPKCLEVRLKDVRSQGPSTVWRTHRHFHRLKMGSGGNPGKSQSFHSCDGCVQICKDAWLTKSGTRKQTWSLCFQHSRYSRTLTYFGLRQSTDDLHIGFIYIHLSDPEQWRKWALALLLFEQISEQVVPDLPAFGAVIANCAVAGRWMQVLCLLESMGKLKIEVDVAHQTAARRHS